MKDYFDIHYKYHVEGKDLDFYRVYVGPQYYDYLGNRDNKILDLGCGTGELLQVISERGYVNLTGIDSSKKQVEFAKKSFPSILFKNEEIISFIKNCDERYDRILLIDVLEHFKKDEIEIVLDYILKMLNPNGKLILKVPNADSPILGLGGRYGDFTHEVIFNETSISMVLRNAGFENIKVFGQRFFKAGLLSLIVRVFIDFILHCYLVAYMGNKAFKVILTASIIVTAEKNN